jgi:phosphatidylserine/phosphatidylglycerophosphate/cardiolipin synthase-like enzyme
MAGADTYMASTATIYTGDTEVTPYIDGVDYFQRIHDQILATKPTDHIFIVNWQIDPYMDLLGPPTQPVDPPPSPPPQNCLLSLLAQQAATGVDVKLVLNGAVFLKRARQGPFIWCLRAAEAFRAAPSLQGSVLFDWTGATFGSHHQKATLITVSGEMFAYIGGMDYWPVRLDKAPYDRQTWADGSLWGWHDAGIEVHGKAVEAVWENFRLRWAEAATQPKYTYLTSPGLVKRAFNPSGSPGDVPASPSASAVSTSPTVSTQILRSRWKVKESNFVRRDKQWDNAPSGQITEVFDTLAKAIDAASTYIYFEDQFLDDMPAVTLGVAEGLSLFSHLRDAAARDVRVILLGSGRGDPDDYGGSHGSPNLRNQQWPDGIVPPLPVPKWVNQVKNIVTVLDQQKPTKKGHNVVVWRFDNITVHAKLALIDDVFCAIGSANMQSRGMAGVDSELTCAFYDSDATNQVRDFRIQLWANHFRIPRPFDPFVLRALKDIDPTSAASAFGLWRPEWGTFPVFSPVPYSAPGVTPATQLTFVGPPY